MSPAVSCTDMALLCPLRYGSAAPRVLMLVVVLVVGRVAVPVMRVVHVVAVRDYFVPAVSAVRMGIMDVVDVARALGAGVAAAWPVHVGMAVVNLVLGCHGSSVL